MTGNEIRKKFIEYFVQNGHTHVSSDSLVPKNDPTLLFTNAGMVQFKNVFLGEESRDYTRAVTAQKCVRAGGKHNDLEMVGRTARHHTFFEMLGNFSFGDYFKKDAIRFGWEFLTDVIGLDKEKLYISIYKDDDEAYEHWRQDIHLADDRIIRLGEKDNFWAMGNTGPCGPCSEIYFDQGPEIGCGKPTCAVGCDCDRYLEIWNLVFMQYERDDTGTLSPLPKPCIDTGMGLERLSAVVQGQTSNYHSDLLMNLIQQAAEITNTPYGQNQESDVSIRVIVDHARSATFLIGDGVLPSNEGRGYVLRRILRRALRHGKLLNVNDAFFFKVTEEVGKSFYESYPDLESHQAFIRRVIQNEEENFSTTLNAGTQKLDEILERLRKTNETQIPGDEIFKLYDTFGFPVDLVEETARDENLKLDMDGFNRAMQEQKEKAMASWKGSGEKEIAPFFKEFLKTNPATRFEGYQNTQSSGRVLAILKDQETIPAAGTSEKIGLLMDATPFYGESGGQVGDAGSAYNDHVNLKILNTTKPIPELILHEAEINNGRLKQGDTLHLEVDATLRNNTALNHTATHLLHAALKEILGDHVKQAGSLVEPGRLRFDYTHFAPLTPRERSRIEERVNEQIRENTTVQTREMSIEDALKEGAMALFGEKYGENVRVVTVPGFSKELCGGTHVRATGDISLFKIVHETGIASGVRRIEALTGPGAFEKIRSDYENLASIRSLLKAQPDEELSRLKKLMEKNRQMEKEIESLKEKLATGKGSSLSDDVVQIGDIALLAKKLEGMDAKTLRTFIDNAKNQLNSAVIVAGSSKDGKVMLAAGVTKDLTEKFHAGNILKEIAGIVGGSGGGRPDMAQAGGNQPEKLDEALQHVETLLRDGQ